MVAISSIGVELEGGLNTGALVLFTHYCADKPVHLNTTRDGSVHVSGVDQRDLEFTMWVKMQDLSQLISAVEYLYDWCQFKTDISCGLHVHMKFDEMEKAVSIISFKKFQNRFIREYKKKYKENSKYLGRLTNRYCKHTRYEEGTVSCQLASTFKNSSRYRAINLGAYKLHGTVEFRLLPAAATVAEFLNSIGWIMRTVEKCLQRYEKKGVKLSINMSDLEDELQRTVGIINSEVRVNVLEDDLLSVALII